MGRPVKGVDEDTAKEVFRKLMGFADYGFPRAHAASFAVLAYQSAWLKYHYPAAFTCALFNNQPMGFYPPHVIVNDARRAGVRVRPPDINASAWCAARSSGAGRSALGCPTSPSWETNRRGGSSRNVTGAATSDRSPT